MKICKELTYKIMVKIQKGRRFLINLKFAAVLRAYTIRDTIHLLTANRYQFFQFDLRPQTGFSYKNMFVLNKILSQRPFCEAQTVFRKKVSLIESVLPPFLFFKGNKLKQETPYIYIARARHEDHSYTTTWQTVKAEKDRILRQSYTQMSIEAN